jgi:hypothetical protein
MGRSKRKGMKYLRKLGSRKEERNVVRVNEMIVIEWIRNRPRGDSQPSKNGRIATMSSSGEKCASAALNTSLAN